MTWPIHPHLIVLRSAATIVISLVIGQAGWASAGLGADPAWFAQHALWAPVTLGATLASLAAYLVLRRTAGPVLVGIAVATAVMVVVQYALGEVGGPDRSAHIFLGVLTAMMATALTSWTYRHPMPDGGRAAGSSGPR